MVDEYLASNKPTFLITIDTEGDDLWSAPRQITTRNALFLPRFQALCEQYHLLPTWLTNHEMVQDPLYREFAQDLLLRDQGEIGMHLHAWNSPPLNCSLTGDDMRHHPYLIEYPEEIMAEKVRVLTASLEDSFNRKMVSHRAGRWAFDQRYARILVEHGYQVDCSVTPHTSWQKTLGDPNGAGGSDYRHFPERCYFMDLQAIHRPGESDLLQVPVSIRRGASFAASAMLQRWESRGTIAALGVRVIRRLWPETRWLRPNGRNLSSMRTILDEILARREPYAELMLHSSELMPDGSPTFRTARQIDALYDDLEQLFAVAADRFIGRTLAGFYSHVQQLFPDKTKRETLFR
ncbi:deacetylase [Candidatus Magnetaquicoccus inordinatus]|uniref:deacetylase n=1 Tax=Candidatus Magnetaquicoccus inordinatus TaxID=2496818 RepID=UPI00102BE05B|nr:deacetylase [Candidatus Magnetaquicoccus inordinatus]